ncbi:hypothetical protein RB195_017094 [Necator americanus]|uniref:Reverse transcriptase domain-containing protein n=1 Tax=Necator americanus TaxID=51031 RepID=A0ABR1C607_NECAM
MPLCLTFIDLKKAFDSVETEAVVEALDNQGVPTQYIKNAIQKLERDDMGVKVDGRQLHHLRFADDIVLITPSISQAERMLTEFDETCGCIGLQLNRQKTMFMRNGWVSDAPFTLNGTNISECTSYVYLGRELNMMNDLTPELGRRRRAAWRAYKSIEDVVKKTRNTRLRAHLLNTTVLSALTYASETWTFRKQEKDAEVEESGSQKEGLGAVKEAEKSQISSKEHKKVEEDSRTAKETEKSGKESLNTAKQSVSKETKIVETHVFEKIVKETEENAESEASSSKASESANETGKAVSVSTKDDQSQSKLVSEQKPISPLVVQEKRVIETRTVEQVLKEEDDVKTAREPEEKVVQTIVTPSKNVESSTRTAVHSSTTSKGGSRRKKTVVQREVVERRQIERIETEEDEDKSTATETSTLEQTVQSSLAPLPPLGGLVGENVEQQSTTQQGEEVRRETEQVQEKRLRRPSKRVQEVQKPPERCVMVPELLREDSSNNLHTAVAPLKTALAPTESSARSPDGWAGGKAGTEGEKAQKGQELRVVDQDAQSPQVSQYRFRFVKPMVVLADINGKIYRLTTHYTIETDRPNLDFKPLSIKFDGQLLWEKWAEISQKIELDTVTSCSTGHGTVTENTPINSGGK